MATFEVEMKFWIKDSSDLIARLERAGAASLGTRFQADHYFNHPARDFGQTDEALRIRQDGEELKITYKGPKIDSQTKTRREIEIPIGKGDATRDQFAEMLLALGFRLVLVVRKNRRYFRLDEGAVRQLLMQDRPAGEEVGPTFPVEATIDEIKGLGMFAEIEAQAGEATLESTRWQIISLAAALGLTRSERRSYLEMLLEKATA